MSNGDKLPASRASAVAAMRSTIEWHAPFGFELGENKRKHCCMALPELPSNASPQ
jgi:hypothetical protein